MCTAAGDCDAFAVFDRKLFEASVCLALRMPCADEIGDAAHAAKRTSEIRERNMIFSVFKNENVG